MEVTNYANLEPSRSETIFLKEVRSESALTSNRVITKKQSAFPLPHRSNDIYATGKSNNIKGLLRKCEKLFDSDKTEFFIHGLGRAASSAIKVALLLKKNHHGILGIDVKSSTVDLTDEVVPLIDDADYEENNRRNSAIHIRVYRIAGAGKLRYDQSN